jgi:hypothetical protein
MKFRTTVELGGKTATGLRVPDEVVTGLGPRKRQPVRVTINGHTYRSTVAPYNSAFMLPLSAEHREAAGVAAGDEIEVDVEVDDAPREVTVPPDLAAALAADPKAAEFFAGLSYTNRNAIVVSVEGAKAAETRQRRITKAIEALREERAR